MNFSDDEFNVSSHSNNWVFMVNRCIRRRSGIFAEMAAWSSKTKASGRSGGRLKRLPSRTACIIIPSLPVVTEEEQATQEVSSGLANEPDSQVHIFEKDPARLELAKAEEARRRRKRDETLLALEKIQDRIDYTITEYEGLTRQDVESNTSLEMVEDANQLFRLLSDPNMRTKYHQKLTVFIVGYEEKHEEMQQVLGQLHEFFEETRAGGTDNLLEEVATEELDLEAATKELGGALATAQNAVKKLVDIKKEMNHLVSIVAAYPDTSKGRKSMEKALMKAQDEVAAVSKNLDEVQATLKASAEKCSQLQVQLDAKNQECAKLRKSADQVRLLQVENDNLKRELEAAKKNLKESQESLSEAKKSQQAAVQSSNTKQVVDLEVALAAEKSKSQKVVAEMEALVQNHAKEMEALKAQHEAESNEARGRFEDQLKSLMEEDVFGEGEMGELGEGDEDADGDLEEFQTSPLPQENVEPDKEVPPSPLPVDPRVVGAEGEELRAAAEEAKEKLKLAQSQAAKARKMVALLQSELADASSKRTSEKEKLEAEVSELKERIGAAVHLSEEFQAELGDLKAEKATLQECVEQKEEELQQLREELRAILERPTSRQHHSAANTTPTPGGDMLGSLSSFRHPQSPMQSVSTVPMAALEESLYGGHHESQVLVSSGDLIGGDDQLSTMEHSIISMDPAPLGSPLQSCTQISPSGGSLIGMHPLLAVSRLSHHSTMTNGNVNHSHPVVTEWGKAYDSIIKFRDSLTAVLAEYQQRIPQFASYVEELQSMELHSLDQKQDVLGQITEMRFSLALLLHQIEQTLKEGFGQMLAELEAHEAGPAPVTSSPLGAEMEGKVAHLTRQMRHEEANHRAEVERNKDTIAQLSNKLENLQIQVAQLRRAAPSGGEGMIMFTRLDSQRNSKALQDALEKNRISSATLSGLTNSMDSYLTIPVRRLAALSQRYQEKRQTAKLAQQVQRTCPDRSQAASIVMGLTSREERRQKEFSSTMSRLGAMRSELAHSLTDTLDYVEKQTKTFLIKPIYSKPHIRSPDLITPLTRPPPVTQCPTVLPSSADKARRRPHTVGGRPSSSNVRLIQSFLQSQRQQDLVNPQKLIDNMNTANSPPSKRTSGTPIPRSKNSPSARHLSPSMLGPSTLTPSPTGFGGTIPGFWNARSSSVMDKEEDTDHDCQPAFSKILELDILRRRQPETLLGHLLAPTLHHGASRRHTPSPLKLLSLPEESPVHSSAASSQGGGGGGAWKRALTPIQVPSRSNTLAMQV